MTLKIQKNKNIYIICLTVIYLLLTCLSPLLHNHGDYSASPDSTASTTFKNSNMVVDRSAASITCPACIFNHNNVGLILSNTPVKTDYLTGVYFSIRDNHIQTSFLSSLHDRAPPTLFS